MNKAKIPAKSAKMALRLRIENLLKRLEQRRAMVTDLLDSLDSTSRSSHNPDCSSELDTLNAAIATEAAAEIVYTDALNDSDAAQIVYEAAVMNTMMAASEYDDCLNSQE